MVDHKNLILAVVLCLVIIFGYELTKGILFPKPPPPQPVAELSEGTGTPSSAPTASSESPTAAPGAVPSVPTPNATQGQIVAPSPTANATETRKAIIAETPRVRLDNGRLHGSISLIGGWIDDVTLADFHETLSPQSPEVVLFSPKGTPDAYFAQTGWVPVGGDATPVPGPDTLWEADVGMLKPGSPVTLTWDNGAGLVFKRIITIDENFMFSVRQAVENTGSAAVTLSPYSLISRSGTPPVSGFFILHEGPLGVFNDTLVEIDYDELQEVGSIVKQSTGGWIGITDKYWLSALIPNQQEAITARFLFERVNNVDRYQVDFVSGAISVAPGAEITSENMIFAGAKEVRLLDYYSEKFGIARFDLAIDFGWFYFLTKPIFYFLLYINEWVGNFGVAILVLTVLIKLIFFPLANKSYKAMSKMRNLQPEMLKLRERFGDDKARLNQEMMALYKREQVNPASGCLPILIQIPVFFALYKVLFVTIEMRHAPFFGWIQDLSARDPTSIWNLFGLIPWDPSLVIPNVLHIGLWPLIMGITMFLQQKLNPQPPDPIQAKIFMFLPVVFTVMLAQFPAGLVIYWTWNNTLSILQQWVIMRGVKKSAKATKTS